MIKSNEVLTLSALESKIALPAPEKEMIRDFYHRTITRFAGQDLHTMKSEVRFIVVSHLVPTLPFYLEALNKMGTIAAVIKKSSKLDPKSIEWLKGWLPIQTNNKGVIVDKDYFDKNKPALLEKINKFVQIDKLLGEKIYCSNLPHDEKGEMQEEKLGIRELLAINGPELIKEWIGDKQGILIDIGGYFAPPLKALQIQGLQKGGVIGIVEDTENGHQLYEQAIRKLTLEEIERVPPIITVARSQIKESEDYNVGKAITDAVDHILRTVDYTHLAESKTILIIGYGKIGSAAAKVASEKTRGPVLICETDAVRRLKASAHSFGVVELGEGLARAEIIICCTGNKCLKKEHLSMVKNHAYIASCTSRDGEFDKTFLSSLNKIGVSADNGEAGGPSENAPQSEGQEEHKTSSKNEESHITRYTIAGKTINLLNNGDSVNFVEKAVHGYFIHGVLASLATAAIRLYLDSPFASRAGRHKDKALKNGVLNDFNTLIAAKEGLADVKEGLAYQSIIADILMQEKLRKEPILTNYQRSSARYLPRDGYVKELNRLLNESREGKVHIVGGKKYGKSQVVEEFFALHGSRYDIVWKFDALSPLEAQFKKFATRINETPTIVSKIGKIEFEKSQEDRRPRSPMKSPQVLVKVKPKQIQEKLEKADFPYLLIFEDIDTLLQTEGVRSLRKYLPNLSRNKREHIIFTSGDKGDVQIEPDFAHLKLTPFETVKLFKFLVNDEAIWKEKKSELKSLAYAFVHPQLNVEEYEGGEIGHQDEGYDIFVAMSNVFSAFMQKHRDYDLQLIIKPKPDEGYIRHFLNTLLQGLENSTKKLLLLFYVINFKGVVCSLDRHELENFLRENLSSAAVSEIDTLLEYGLIEDKNGSLCPVLTHISANGGVDELLGVIQAHVRDNIEQLDELDEYKNRGKHFIINLTVKQFCQEDQISLLPMVVEIAKSLKEPQEVFYRDWKKESRELYRLLLEKLGNFYLENEERDKAREYYSDAEKEYSLLLEVLNGPALQNTSKAHSIFEEEIVQERRQMQNNVQKKIEKFGEILLSIENDRALRQKRKKNIAKRSSLNNTPKAQKRPKHETRSIGTSPEGDQVQSSNTLGRWSLNLKKRKLKGQNKALTPNKRYSLVQGTDNNTAEPRNLTKFFEEAALND
jgi:S-adenosylhomocysteine hydrolase